jgi:uncharacterized repeat protein (TIGR01451 family)
VISVEKENAMYLKTLFSRKIILVFCSVMLMMSLLGIKAQAETLSSLSGREPSAPDAPDAVLTHTTVPDFDQTCTLKTNTHIRDNGGNDGSVELSGAFNDNFDGTTVDSTRWVSGSWIGGALPVVSSGKLTLPSGGYVRSINTVVFNRAVMEAKVEFTQSPWQQVGFAVNFENDPKFLFFSVLNTAGITPTLNARTGLFDFHDEPITPFPTGMHRYKIQWLASDLTHDLANFYQVDVSPNPVYTSEVFTSTILSNANLWISNNILLNMSVDEIQVAAPPYAASGSYISCPLDAGVGSIWQSAAWVSSLPALTTLTVQTRTSADGVTWPPTWNTVGTSGGAITSPNRYVQYQLILGTTNTNATPVLDSISLTSGGFSADLSLTKTTSMTNPDVGQAVDFTVTVSNAGPNPATGVEVRDLLQTGFTYSSANASIGTYSNTTGIWTVGTIPAAGNAVLTIHAVVNPSGTYSNVAEVTASGVPDPDSTPNNGANAEDDYKTITLVPVPVADLRVTKTDSSDPAVAGTDLTYVVTVQNLGPSTANTVVFTDTLPTGVTYKSVTPGTWTCTTPTTGKVRCSLGTLAVTSSNVSIVTTVKPDTRVSITNQVDVKSASVDLTLPNNTFQETTTISSSADLELAKVARSTSPVMGSTQVFTVTVTNKGPSQATGVKVKDLLESGYQFAGATGAGAYDQNSGEWTVGTLAVNQSVSLRLSGTVKTTGTYNNYSQVIVSNEPDPDSTPNDNSTTQDDDASIAASAVPGADLSLIKQVSNSTPKVGDTVVFTVTVTNAGPSPATGVTMKDLLNSGYTFVSSSQPGSYDNQTGMWNVGTLQPGENKKLAITVQIKATGNYQNVAEVWQSPVTDIDSTPGNGVSTEDDYGAIVINPGAVADLSIVKTLITTKPEKGKTVEFQIHVTNSGPSDTTGVTIRDNIPLNHVFVSSDHTAVQNADTLTWNLGTIPAGEEVVIQLILQANVSGSYSNQVQVWTSNVYDPDSQPGNSALGEDDISTVQYSVNFYFYLPFVVKVP